MLTLPKIESQNRLEKLRQIIAHDFPNLDGIFLFSRLNIYYFTGTLAHGVLWIPNKDEPILFVRKGIDRAIKESAITSIFPYKSFGDIEKTCIANGKPIKNSAKIGMETNAMPYQLTQLFLSKISAFSQNQPISIDNCIKKVRSRKSPYEAEKMREAGKRQALSLEKILPYHIQNFSNNQALYQNSLTNSFVKLENQEALLTEQKIAELCIQIYTELEHGGLCRMSAYGEEAFYGHVACGNSLNTAHYYNGAMGFEGVSPLLPCLGSQRKLEKNDLLCVDMLFNYQGYLTDKTQCYFNGKEKDFPDIAKKALACCIEIQDLVQKKLVHGTIPEQIWFESIGIVKKFGFEENYMGYKQNAVPFLGHSIGLTVDESPVIAKGFCDKLENGMFLACEPKIALPHIGMVGIENTFELIDDTVKNITTLGNPIIFLDE